MNAVTPFRFQIVIDSDVARAKAGLADVQTGMQGVSAEAARTTKAAQAEAAALEKLAAATAKAALSQTDLAAAERQAAQNRRSPSTVPFNVLAQTSQQAMAPTVALRGAETAAASLQQTLGRLGTSFDASIHDMMAATVEARIYRDSLDEIRAALNPLFAASRQYEEQLDRIARAEEVGAISAKEAAAARARAAQIIAPAGSNGSGGRSAPDNSGIARAATANLSFQMNDVAMMTLMGQSPLMLVIQQGPQIAQIFSQLKEAGVSLGSTLAGAFRMMLTPWGLFAMAAIGGGAALVQGLMSLKGETKSAEEALSALAESVKRVGDANKAARMSISDLAAEFGSTASEAKELLSVLAEIERRSASRDAKSALNSIFNDLSGGSMLGLRSQSDRFGSLQRMFGEASWLTSGRVSEEGSPLTFAVDTAMKQVAASADTDDLDAQIEAVTELFEAVQVAAAAYDDMSEAEDKWIRTIGKSLKELQSLKAQDENAPGRRRAEELTLDYQRRVEVERAILRYGEQSAEVRAIENRQEREALRTRLESLGLSRGDVEMRQALAALTDLQVAREEAVLEERRAWLRSKQDELAAIQLEISLVGQTNAEAERAKAIAEAELEIRNEKLGILDATLARVQAIATAEARARLERERAMQQLRVDTALDGFDAQIRRARDPITRANLEAQREYIRLVGDGMDADLAAAQATRVRANALDEAAVAAEGHLRGQAERIAALQLEIALAGQSADVRARVLAMVQAERAIREQGLTGEAAASARRNVEIETELVRTLDAQADAWRRVQSAGEGAIDGILDKLRGGDVTGALEDLASEIGGLFFDLQVRNPMKNAILGTNLGTMGDVGGLRGIWDRLTGRAPVDEAEITREFSAPVQTMTISAAQVTLQAGALDLSSLSGLVANSPGAPGSVPGAKPGSDFVQAQVWSYFTGKGLAPHQVAAVMGHMAAESGFDPTISGDNGNAIGLFQHNGPRMRELLGAIGGKGNLGNVQAQLDFAWMEMNRAGTLENRAFQQLMAAPDLRSGVRAFAGFERPQGFTWGNPEASHNYTGRLAAAEAAMTTFSQATQTATGNLGTLGKGFDVFGTALSGAASGGLDGLLGALGSGIASALGIPGFSGGGPTGGSSPDEVRGLVHGKEFVFDAEATARIGVPTLEAIRKGTIKGYRDGGSVGPAPILTSRGPVLAATAPAPVIQIQPVLVNNTGRPVQVETEETVDARGQRQMKYVLSDATADALAVPGGRAGKVMRSDYGIQRAPRLRP